MDVELRDTIRALAMRYGNYRFAQARARERGEDDQADAYANEGDKTWRELCRVTAVDGTPSKPSGDGSQRDQVSSMDADRGGERSVGEVQRGE